MLIKGASSTTKKIPRHHKRGDDPVVESDEQIVSRMLRHLSGARQGEIVVLNDDADNCYRDRLILYETRGASLESVAGAIARR